MTTINQAGETFGEPYSFQAMAVVEAARRWAAEVWEENERRPVEHMRDLPTPELRTEQERAERVLLDAVHDLEHHGQPAQRSRPPTLFDPSA